MDYKKLEDLHLPKKDITKITKKIKQMGLVLEVNIFECVWMTESNWCVMVCVSNIQVCTMFFFFVCLFSFFGCLPRCMEHKRPFLSFCWNGDFVLSCSERVSLLQTGSLYVWVNDRERGQLHKHILSLTSSFIPR